LINNLPWGTGAGNKRRNDENGISKKQKNP